VSASWLAAKAPAMHHYAAPGGTGYGLSLVGVGVVAVVLGSLLVRRTLRSGTPLPEFKGRPRSTLLTYAPWFMVTLVGPPDHWRNLSPVSRLVPPTAPNQERQACALL
jgi:hypothetical protein